MTDSEKYWFEHLRLIDRTGSTTKAYADLHGLSAVLRIQCTER